MSAPAPHLPGTCLVPARHSPCTCPVLALYRSVRWLVRQHLPGACSARRLRCLPGMRCPSGVPCLRGPYPTACPVRGLRPPLLGCPSLGTAFIRPSGPHCFGFPAGAGLLCASFPHISAVSVFDCLSFRHASVSCARYSWTCRFLRPLFLHMSVFAPDWPADIAEYPFLTRGIGGNRRFRPENRISITTRHNIRHNIYIV